MLIDTQTGKTWVNARLSDMHNRMVWVYVTRLDDKKAVRDFIAYKGSTPPAKDAKVIEWKDLPAK